MVISINNVLKRILKIKFNNKISIIKINNIIQILANLFVYFVYRKAMLIVNLSTDNSKKILFIAKLKSMLIDNSIKHLENLGIIMMYGKHSDLCKYK